jgi:SAM-dependent methyltransferase
VDQQRQTEVFVNEEADRYFERNKGKRSITADHLLSVFPRELLAALSVAEWGIGAGQNLMLLANYCASVAGYDASPRAVEYFRQLYVNRSDADRFFVKQVNVCTPFSVPEAYDIVIFGFFAYYASDAELLVARSNLDGALKPGGYVFVHDFLVRASSARADKHNPKLSVFKRDLQSWLDYFGAYDLVHFRLVDADGASKAPADAPWVIDPNVPDDDSAWSFTALWKKRPITSV